MSCRKNSKVNAKPGAQPCQPLEHPPLEGTCLEEGGEECGTIKAVTQKGCGFSTSSFESLRDLGCVCPWFSRPQNWPAQGVGRSGGTDLLVLREPSSIRLAEVLPLTCREQSWAAPVRKWVLPLAGQWVLRLGHP